VKVLRGFGPILILGGGLFLLDGARQLYREHIQSTKWPAVNARIESCSIYEQWGYAGTPNTKTVLRRDSYVRCRVQYRAGDTERESFVKVGDALSTYGGHSRFLASKPTADMMQGWISRHHAGSLLIVHYDPSVPGSLSLAGNDNDLRAVTPLTRLWFGITTCIGGLVLVAAVTHCHR